MRNDNSIVLTGAGAYAAYEVGVMQALFAGKSPSTSYQPYDPGLLVASSAGALNLAILVSNEQQGLANAVRQLESVWLNRIADDESRCGNGVYRVRGISYENRGSGILGCLPTSFSNGMEDFLKIGEEFVTQGTAFLTSTEPLALKAAQSVDVSAFVTSKPLESTIKRHVSIQNLISSQRDIRIVATNLTTGLPKLFSKEDIRKYGWAPLFASTALPAFFRPSKIGDDSFIDGSTLAGIPLLPAVRESRTVHAIYMDPSLSSIQDSRLRSSIDVIDRTLVLKFAYLMNREIDTARKINRVLKLIEDQVQSTEVSQEEIHDFLEMGYWIYQRLESGTPYRQLTIHRYHPRDDLGDSLGLMNLKPERIKYLIERGYHDTVNHDCEESECVIP